MNKERWYKVTAFVDDDIHLLDAKIPGPDGEMEQRSIYLKANFYDDKGELLLCCGQMDMERLPHMAVDKMRMVMQANLMSPVLILPKGVDFVKLKVLSPMETERVKKRIVSQQQQAAEQVKDTAANIDDVLAKASQEGKDRDLKLVK